jgi:NAD-dependent protein deacetylase/lipoamidase
MRRELATAGVQPNAGHAALVDLERQGRLRALLTQNIDGLHHAAGSSAGAVAELHGTVHEVVCTACGARMPTAEVLPRLDAGDPDPACPVCGGVLKTATVYFGEALDADVLDAAAEAAADCDVFLAVGTSLGVYPAAGLVEVAAAHGARVVIVNAEPTPYDRLADLVVREPIGTALPAVVQPAH